MNKPLNNQTVELLARLSHEVNRAYCATLGDVSQVEWVDAPDWQKDSARAGVRSVLNGEAASPEEQHALWMDLKVKEGWVYGPTKDANRKTHPCMVEYNDLAPEQRVKDHLFRAAVLHGLNMLCDYATDASNIQIGNGNVQVIRR